MTRIPTIDDTHLAAVHGGAGRPKALGELIERLGQSDLSSKQIKKLNNKLDKFESKGKRGTVPAIAEGDFGAPPSSFVPIRGD